MSRKSLILLAQAFSATALRCIQDSWATEDQWRRKDLENKARMLRERARDCLEEAYSMPEETEPLFKSVA